MVTEGCSVAQKHIIMARIGYQEGTFPFRYLGVPITANKLSKMECSLLVEKLTKKLECGQPKSPHIQAELLWLIAS